MMVRLKADATTVVVSGFSRTFEERACFQD